MFHFSNFAKKNFSLSLAYSCHSCILNKALSCLRNLCRQTTNERKRKKERLGSSFCIFSGHWFLCVNTFSKKKKKKKKISPSLISSPLNFQCGSDRVCNIHILGILLATMTVINFCMRFINIVTNLK